MENGFVNGRKEFLLRRLKWLCYLHLLASLSVTFVYVARQNFKRDNLPSDAAFLSFTAQAVAETAVACLLVVALLVLRLCDGSPALQSPRLLEVSTVLFMIMSMSLVILTFPTKFAKLQGFSLTEAFGDPYGSDSSMVLTIDIFVTATHLGLPIRWHAMAPLEFAALGLYILVILIVGSEENRTNIFFNFMLLSVLVVAASFGKRSSERDERRAFVEMLKEKSMRYEAEFQLSQVEGKQKDKQKDLQSQLSSEPVTDKSGAIFEPLFEKCGDRRQQLQLVAAKGESEHWRIPSTEVQLLSKDATLGSGGFGEVQRAVFCGMMVAVKCPRLDLDAARVADLCNELRVLRHLRHPNIVTSHGAVILPEQEQIYLVLELIDGMSLSTYLSPRQPDLQPSLLQRFQIMVGTCRALLYMHTRRPHIVHGDLKGANVMIEVAGDNAYPKLLDFGLSRVISAQPRALGGTLAWLAPEVIDRAPVRCSADVYSFGRLIAFVATSIPPMWNMDQVAILRTLQKKQPPLPEWPRGCAFTPGCKPLVQDCLKMQQEDRPPMDEVYLELLKLSSELELPKASFVQQVREVAQLTSQPPEVLRKKKLPSTPEEETTIGTTGTLRTTAPLITPPPAAPEKRQSDRRPRLPMPELPETSTPAMQSTLIAAFQRWNSNRVRVSCCERHAWFKLGQEVCSEVLQHDCVPGAIHHLLPDKVRHCWNCGVLGVTGDRCEFCGASTAEDSDEPDQPNHTSL